MHCGIPYVYLNEQSGYGESASIAFIHRERADSGALSVANIELTKRLESNDALARCPTCGLYQKSMVTHGKRDRENKVIKRGLVFTLVPVFALGIAAGIFSKLTDWFLLAAFGTGLLGIAATVGWALVVRMRFDPNRGRNFLMPPDEEIASSGMTVEDFERMAEAEQTVDDA